MNPQLERFHAQFLALWFFGEVDNAENQEDEFAYWFIKTFGEIPSMAERLEDPFTFRGLASRYSAIQNRS